jgi:hypothetical protein
MCIHIFVKTIKAEKTGQTGNRVNVRQEEFEDTKGVIRIRISKNRPSIQWPKEKVQKDKQRSTKQT